MDIEQLSKTQIILLVLLVTFVTSIATGIVTVSLMAQAPPAVTQTVNHVIQRTVEAVAPSTGATTVKETTVVVKEEDLVTNSIASSFAKLGKVHAGVSTSSPVIALGVMVSGVLVTDAALVTDDDHLVSFEATSTVFATKGRLTEVGVAVLTPVSGPGPAGFRIADVDSTKLGQTVIALPSATGNRVGIGAITARYTLARLGKDEAVTPVRAVESNVNGAIMGGAPLVTVFGDVVGITTGISTGPSGGLGTFVALSDIAPLILGVRGTTTPAIAE